MAQLESMAITMAMRKRLQGSTVKKPHILQLGQRVQKQWTQFIRYFQDLCQAHLTTIKRVYVLDHQSDAIVQTNWVTVL